MPEALSSQWNGFTELKYAFRLEKLELFKLDWNQPQLRRFLGWANRSRAPSGLPTTAAPVVTSDPNAPGPRRAGPVPLGSVGLGRSMTDLLETIKHLEAVGVDLYLDQQNLDTTTPHGKLLFQITGAFAEFERSMIQQRVRAGLKVVRDQLARDGKFETRRRVVCTKLGRPGAERISSKPPARSWPSALASSRPPKLTGLGVGTVHRLKREIGDHAAN